MTTNVISKRQVSPAINETNNKTNSSSLCECTELRWAFFADRENMYELRKVVARRLNRYIHK